MAVKHLLIVSVIVSVAVSVTSSSHTPDQICSQGNNKNNGECIPPVKVCANGAGEWTCDGIKFNDNTFTAIFEGKCKITKEGHRKCGTSTVNHRKYIAAQSGRCNRICKRTIEGPECECAECKLNTITCIKEGGTVSMDSQSYHTFQTRVCHVQHHSEEPHVVCRSPKGEIRSSMKAYIDLLHSKCSYTCTPNISLKTCSAKLGKPKQESVNKIRRQDEENNGEENNREVNNGEVNNGEVNNGEVNNGEVNNGEVNNGDVNNGEVNNGEEKLIVKVHTTKPQKIKKPAKPTLPRKKKQDVQPRESKTISEVATKPSPVEKDTKEVTPQESNDDNNTKYQMDKDEDSPNPAITKSTVPMTPAPGEEPEERFTPAQPPHTQLNIAELIYTIGEWEQCTATCGLGIRHRDVVCTLKNDLNLALPMEVCKEVLGEQPSNNTTCMMPPCEIFTPITVRGEECPGTCGSGIATKSLICQSSMGTTVSLARCGLAATQITDVFTETISLDTTLPQRTLHLPNGACDQDAHVSAQGFMELNENSTLYDPEKYDSSQCKNRLQVNGVLQEKCAINECSRFVWKTVIEWTKCSKTCGGGTQFREFACYEDGKRVEDEQCTSPKPSTSKSCNTALCAISTFTWKLGPWSECDKECSAIDIKSGEVQNGYAYREVTCTAVDGMAVANSKCNGVLKPVDQKICAKTACEFCDIEEPCSLQGNCLNRQCKCNKGFGGKRCEFKVQNCTVSAEDPVCCPSTIVDKDGGCCQSGAVDKRGSCCQSDEHLDGNGFCCSEKVDACGVCGGPAVAVDVFGQCCPTSVDASGQCCISGSVDECGVCDGDGSSCNHILHVSAVVNQSMYTEPQGSVQGTQENQQAEATVMVLSSLLQIERSYIHVIKIRGQSVKPKDLKIMQARRKLFMAGFRKNRKALRLAAKKRELLQDTNQSGASLSMKPSATEVDMEILIDGAAKLSTSKAINAFMNQPDIDISSNTGEKDSISKVIQSIKLISEEKQGICGNGVCELEERHTLLEGSQFCAADCGVEIKMPPYAEVNGATKFCSERGRPILSSGICQCYSGYTGDACNECMSGYITTSNPAGGPPSCTMDFATDKLTDIQPRLPLPLQSLPSPDAGTLTKEGTSAQAGPSMLAIIAIGVVATAIIVGVIMIFIVKSAKQKRPQEPTTIPIPDTSVSPTIAFRGLPDERKSDSDDEDPVEPHLVVNSVSMGEALRYTTSLESILEVNEDEYYDYEDGESDDYPMETIRLDDTDQESDLDSELDRMERGM